MPAEFWADFELLLSQLLITTTISAPHPRTLPRLRGRLRASFRAVMDTLMGSRSIMRVDDVRVG